MEQLWNETKATLRGMWQHRFTGLAVAWIVGAVAVAVALQVPERYEASARLFVDGDTFLKPLFAGLAVQPNVEQQVALVSRTLISRPNVEKMVAAANLDAGSGGERSREALVDDLMQSLKLTSLRENVYQINYRDTDPQRAARVVRAALDIFVESSVGGKKQETEASLKVLDEQVKRFEDSLRSTEDRLKDFKLKNMASGRGGGDYFARLTELQMQVDQARLEVASAEQRRDTYRRELAAESSALQAPGVDEKALALADLDVRVAQARKDLDALSLKYTDIHPDVVNARRLLAELEAQRKAAAASVRSRPPTGPSRSTAGLPPAERGFAIQQLRLSLRDAEATVAAARNKLAGYELQYRKMQEKARAMPEIEAEFAQLNRDYEVQRRMYENLLARRDQAMVGTGVQDSGVARLRIVDPPRVSGQPVAPDRLMLLAAAFGAAIAAGLAAAFVASRVRPTFHDARSLRLAFGRPTVGIVSLLATPAVAQARRRRAALFAGGLGVLLVSFATLATLTALAERTS